MDLNPHADVLHRCQAFMKIMRLENKAKVTAAFDQHALRSAVEFVAKQGHSAVLHVPQTADQGE
jgi:hypothetical protein